MDLESLWQVSVDGMRLIRGRWEKVSTTVVYDRDRMQ